MTNKFAFFFPAKIAFAESNVELEPLEFQDVTFYLGPIGKKYYFSIDKRKIVFEHIENDKRQIFFKCLDCVLSVHLTFVDNIQAFLEGIIDRVKESIPKWEAQLNNTELYEQEAAKTREKIKAERTEQDKKLAEQKQIREQVAQKAYEDSLEVFKEGKYMIEWSTFERAIKENGITLPIKTIGFGRKNVSKIGVTGYSICGSKHNSPVLWAAIRKLKEKLA